MNDLFAEKNRPAKLSKLLSIELIAARHFVGHTTMPGVMCGVLCSGVFERVNGIELENIVFFLFCATSVTELKPATFSTPIYFCCSGRNAIFWNPWKQMLPVNVHT